MGAVVHVILAAENARGDADDGDQAQDHKEENNKKYHQSKIIFLVSTRKTLQKAKYDGLQALQTILKAN